MLRKINATILAMILTLTMGVTVYAENGGVGQPGGTNAGVNANVGTTNTGVNQGYNNMYRATAAEDDVDWGWLGLLGLAGLAGLMGRNRERDPQR